MNSLVCSRLLIYSILILVMGVAELRGSDCSLENRYAHLLASGEGSVMTQPADSNRVWFSMERLGGGTIRFRAESTYPERLEYYWDFGDGTGSLLRSPRHDFLPVTIPRRVILRAWGEQEYSYSRMVLPFIEYDFEPRVLAAVEAVEVYRFAGRFIPAHHLPVLRELQQQRTFPDLQQVLIRLRREEILSGFGGRDSEENHPSSYLLLTNPVTGEVVAVLTSKRGDFRYDLEPEERQFNREQWQEEFRSYRPIFFRFSE